MITHYDWAGGREAMWRFGPDTGPVVVAALPLFEEANRTRTFVVTVLRMLAERGIASALPDLPGQGESTVPTEQCTLAKMQDALNAAIRTCSGEARHCYGFSVRSGALIKTNAEFHGQWQLSPQTGSELLRELGRTANVGMSPDWWCASETVEIAGNLVSSELLSALFSAKIEKNALGAPLRTIRLTTDAKPSDHKFDGPPLWRRAEPGNDPALAALIADDIAQWVRACEA